ncbi:DUF1080 domain-containing protein [Luteolibacter yonseiensis]|uniref:DUF1080 domain-containing protein n=1 Tax=Luteolibacter yonseiensis TaxID=1144680 RepID=A0A934R3N0_9BACT|nr:family 16 glycoside hydrolase [Luteolibacter yonseiensis]MBK1815473.1 DUF1080 domain-containing protein [Luteolibacter yonseiensis]
MSPNILKALPLVTLMGSANAADWTPLFNGKDMDGWTTVLDKSKPGEDPNHYVQVRDGSIHMYADTDTSATVPFGVIVHDKTFSRFHLSLEYRWGGKRFAPRKNDIRDAGVIYHATNTGKIWPDSVEYQIQEGDTGDIVYLPKSGLTWMHPDPKSAPEGQGDPGMLPEDGGTPKDFTGTNFAYVGRYPVLDTVDGWNHVEVIVQADRSAEHIVNGRTRARISQLQEKNGDSLKEGKIALQLEGAEILYRDVKIRELGEPLAADRGVVSMSAVKGQKTRKATLTVKNPSGGPLAADISVVGKDAALFKATATGATIPAGGSTVVTVEFSGTDTPGRFSAGLQIGSKEEGAFVILQGIGLAAFEGKNEPPLQSIVHALGIPLDVGGGKLELDSKKDTIGQSVAVPAFQAAGAGKIRVTPLARFSPPEDTPFGIVLSGGSELSELGKLSDSSAEIPDAHQTLFPPLVGGAGSVEFDAPSKPFAFYMKGHKFDSFSDPAIPTKAEIPHTARVYPVRNYQGRKMENAWLVGFEEASNGDYQDALFLIENAAPAK